jgi:multiple sugar transport system permease protein
MPSAPTEAEPRSSSRKAPRTAGSGGVLLGARSAALFLTPSGVLIGVFLVFPALWTIYLGLTNYRLTGPTAADADFVGFENYTRAVTDPAFTDSLTITLVYVLGSAFVGQAVLGFALAWILKDWRPKVRQAVEMIVIIAWIIPGSVVAFLWLAFLDGNDGTLNQILGTDTSWLLRNPLLSIIVFNAWRGTAFSMMLFGAALASLPPSHLQTARLVGASTFQQLRDVVLPSIRGYITTTILLISLWTFNDFGPYLLTGGGPAGQTEVLPIFIYVRALRFFDFGYGSAASTVMLTINLVFALVYLRFARQRS